jgi:hypothetical protein
MKAPTHLEAAERAVARLEAASEEHPLEFLDDLAWALSHLANARSRVGDHDGAVEASLRAVARVRTLAGMGGTISTTRMSGGQLRNCPTLNCANVRARG